MSELRDVLAKKYSGIQLQELCEMCFDGGLAMWKGVIKNLSDNFPERCNACNHKNGHFLLTGGSGGIDMSYRIICGNCGVDQEIEH